MDRLKHFAFLLILLGRAMTKNVKQKDAPEVCTLNDQQYPVGATWHPVLAPFGAMPCANCTCLPNAIVHCVHLTQDCPEPKCDAPKILPNRCCPECEDFDNIPPTVLTKENSTKTKKLGCTFYGRSYEHGAIFTSNKTALKPTRSNQCVTCICSNGRILCHLKTCETIKYEPSTVTQRSPTTDEPDFAPHSCITVDAVHKNGTTWHPVLTPFGPLLCVLCTCINSQTLCNKIECPKISNCARPRKVDGQCCPVCKNKICKGKKCWRNRNKQTSTSLPMITQQPSSTTTYPTRIFHNLCMPKGTDRIVYMSNDTAFLMLAFHHVKKSKVNVLRWDVPKKGRLSNLTVENMNAKEFRSRTKSTNILGATNKKRFLNKFWKKVKKQMKRCRKSCRQKRILKLIKQLRLKKIRFTENCKE